VKGELNMKDSYFSHIKNPMTIISLFVGLVEVTLGLSLAALPDGLKSVIVWFLVLFPTLNAIAFFIVLIRYPQNFYGPRDYQSDQSFLSSLQVRGSITAGKPASDRLDAPNEAALDNQQSLPVQTDTSSQEEKSWFRFMMDREYEKAIDLLNDDLAKAKSDSERMGSRLLIGHIRSLMDFQSGTAYFQELIHEFPSEESPYTWLAYSYLSNGMPEKCMALVDLGLSRVQEKAPLKVARARCLVRLGHAEEAVTMLEESINDSPSEISYYTELIEIVVKQDPNSAETWYRKGLSVSPRNETLLSEYAKFLSENNRKEEALYRYRTLTDIAPKNTTYLTLLGNVYLDLELNNKALDAYEKANSLGNESEGWIIANIGNLYKNRGFYSKAITFLNKALSIRSDDEYAHERLAAAIKGQAEENNKADELAMKGQQNSLAQERLASASPPS
jgi:tetratricopeptide (TPR) repeat protein